MRKLTRNAAKCLFCGDVIESRSVHDFVTCSCGNLSVDGGLDYIKRCFKLEDWWKELSEWEEIEDTVPEECDNGSEISFYIWEDDEDE